MEDASPMCTEWYIKKIEVKKGFTLIVIKVKVPDKVIANIPDVERL